MRKTVTVATLDGNFAEALKESYDWTCAYPDCPY